MGRGRPEPPADWSSYATIAGRYDDVWGSRFDAVAQLLWERVPLSPKATVLDIGTGTGIVLGALGARASRASLLAGCDRSSAMVTVARTRLSGGCFVVAEAALLPFGDATFDVATAGFVLSHLQDYEAGLREAGRVLKPAGIFAMTSWATDTDVHVNAWRELLAGAVSEELVRAAVSRVAPWEAFFERAEAVRDALSGAGYLRVEVHPHTVRSSVSLERFLADRELGAAARFARHALGSDAWESFLGRAHDDLQRRFGSTLELERGILIGIGRRS